MEDIEFNLPGSTLWERVLYKATLDFLNDNNQDDEKQKKRNEKKYLDKHRDSAGRLINWQELRFVKQDRNLFIKLLCKLSRESRRRVLLAANNISGKQLIKIYGGSADKVSGLFNPRQHKYDLDFLSNIAILCRVPFNVVYRISLADSDFSWDTHHFRYLQNDILDPNGFLVFLEERISMPRYVEGRILEDGLGTRLYLRIEIKQGGFFIDICNKNASGNELYIMKSILKDFQMEKGIIHTIDPLQKNFVFVSKNIAEQPDCLPSEYEKI
jgi:hypothetical protein